MIKHVYGLSGCHREGLVFLVRPEFLLNVGGAQWDHTQLGRHRVTSRSLHLASSFSLGSRAVHMVLCTLVGWVIVAFFLLNA